MSEYTRNSRNSLRDRSEERNGILYGQNYERLDQSDSERTRDEFLEAMENDKKKKEEYNKSNLFKSRIIGKK